MHLDGGSILGTSRTNPAKSGGHGNVPRRASRAEHHGPGDRSAATTRPTRRARSTSRRGGTIRVAHVPKTIDNDLPLPGSTPTFGFETARQLGVPIVRNLAEDAKTTSRWYLIVSMGRAAGHLALGIGKAAAATLDHHPRGVSRPAGSRSTNCATSSLGAIIKRKSQGRALRRRRAGRGADRSHRRARAARRHRQRNTAAATAKSNATRTATCGWARSNSAAWSRTAGRPARRARHQDVAHRQGPRLRAALRRPDPVRRRVHPRPGLRGGQVPCARRMPPGSAP